MKFIVDEIDPYECPFCVQNDEGDRCRCGEYAQACDYDYKKDLYECEFCISIKKIKDGDPD